MFKTIPVPLLKQYAVVFTVNLLTLCVGMDLGWTSPVLLKLRDPGQSPLSRPITEAEGGWIVSIGYIFSIFTLPFVGLLTDYIGRRYTILLACLPKVITGVMTIFAKEVWILLVVRAVNGIVNMSAMAVINIYSTEISSKEIRGSLGSFIAIFCNLGIFIMLTAGPYISYLNLSILVTAVTVCTSIPLLFIPDTPYSLYKKGKIEESRKVLNFFRGSQALAEDELKELSQTKSSQKIDISVIFKNKAYVKALAIVLMMSIGVQLVGFNCISFYLQTILELSNTNVSSATGSVIIGIIQILSSIFSGLVIDRFGRKPILVCTLFAMAMGMSGLGIFFLVKKKGVFISGFLNYLPLISIAVVTFSFSGGIGSLYFVLVTELLDGPIRAIGSAAGSVVTSTVIFLLSRYTMAIITAMGPDATFILFGVVCIMMSLFIFFFVPETKQKSIVDIQRALGGMKADGQRKESFTHL